MASRGVAKGSPRTPGSGRKKGSKNKLPALLSDMILQALDQAGGVEYLFKQSQSNPNAFISLLGKIVPTHLKHSNDPTNPMPGVNATAIAAVTTTEDAQALFNAALHAAREKRLKG